MEHGLAGRQGVVKRPEDHSSALLTAGSFQKALDADLAKKNAQKGERRALMAVLCCPAAAAAATATPYSPHSRLQQF